MNVYTYMYRNNNKITVILLLHAYGREHQKVIYGNVYRHIKELFSVWISTLINSKIACNVLCVGLMSNIVSISLGRPCYSFLFCLLYVFLIFFTFLSLSTFQFPIRRDANVFSQPTITKCVQFIYYLFFYFVLFYYSAFLSVTAKTIFFLICCWFGHYFHFGVYLFIGKYPKINSIWGRATEYSKLITIFLFCGNHLIFNVKTIS